MSEYVGLDLSLCKTGIVILDNNKNVTLSAVLKPKTYKGVERLDYLEKTILSTIETCSDLQYIVIEGYSFASRGRGVFNIGELGGIIRLSLFRKNLADRTLTVQPMTLKKFVADKGNCKKEIMIKEVFRKYNFNTDDDNIADAFGLAMMGYCYANKPKLNKRETETIKKMELL